MNRLPQRVELCEYDPQWKVRAEREARRLHAALGPTLVTVHHVGSTAIEGLVAKPILDLIPEFITAAAMETVRETLESLGYAWHGEYGLPGRRYCTLSEANSGTRLVHAHCYASGSAEIERHLAFRDYLRAHREVAAAYGDEKRRCQALYAHDSRAYSQAKGAWIRRIEAEALLWYRRREVKPLGGGAANG